MSHFREDLARLGEGTKDILDQGFYFIGKEKVSIQEATDRAVENAVLYPPDALRIKDERVEEKYKTKIETTEETTLAAARRLQDQYGRVLALNFASARHPGGGWLTGAPAQEESLARASALVPTLTKFPKMYKFNDEQRTGLYSDYMIYSPDVPVFRGDKGNLLEAYYPVSFVTSPAPNAGAVEQNEPQNKKFVDSTMRERIKKILRLAIEQEHEALVLGAFGCGVFKNNPYAVSLHFKNALMSAEFKGQFQHVTFAVYDRSENKTTYKVFKGALG